jgi:hypothetical protein
MPTTTTIVNPILEGAITAADATTTTATSVANVGTLDSRYFSTFNPANKLNNSVGLLQEQQEFSTTGGWVQILEIDCANLPTTCEFDCEILTSSGLGNSFALKLSLDSYLSQTGGAAIPQPIIHRISGPAGTAITGARVRVAAPSSPNYRKTFIDVNFVSGTYTAYLFSRIIFGSRLGGPEPITNLVKLINPVTTGQVIQEFGIGNGAIIKNTTGNYTGGREGQLVINSIDNTYNVFKNGVWTDLASGSNLNNPIITGTITAADASGVTATSVANVGTLDARYALISSIDGPIKNILSPQQTISSTGGWIQIAKFDSGNLPATIDFDSYILTDLNTGNSFSLKLSLDAYIGQSGGAAIPQPIIHRISGPAGTAITNFRVRVAAPSGLEFRTTYIDIQLATNGSAYNSYLFSRAVIGNRQGNATVITNLTFVINPVTTGQVIQEFGIGNGAIIKNTTGNYTGGREGQLVINSIDNTYNVFKNGVWTDLASGSNLNNPIITGTITAADASGVTATSVANVGTLDARYALISSIDGPIKNILSPQQTISSTGGWIQIAKFDSGNLPATIDFDSYILTDLNTGNSFSLKLSLDAYIGQSGGAAIPQPIIHRISGPAGTAITNFRVRVAAPSGLEFRTTYIDIQLATNGSAYNSYLFSRAVIGNRQGNATVITNLTFVINPVTTGQIIQEFGIGNGAIIKNTTGDYTGGREGQLVINSVDSNTKIYSNGAWQLIPTSQSLDAKYALIASPTFTGAIIAADATTTTATSVANVGTLDARYAGAKREAITSQQIVNSLGGWVQVGEFQSFGYQSIVDFDCYITTDNNLQSTIKLIFAIDAFSGESGAIQLPFSVFNRKGNGIVIENARVRVSSSNPRITYIDFKFVASTNAVNSYIFTSTSFNSRAVTPVIVNITPVVNPTTTGQIIEEFVPANGCVVKSTTGDYTNPREGQLVINPTDNTYKVYADGDWRIITTWV